MFDVLSLACVISICSIASFTLGYFIAGRSLSVMEKEKSLVEHLAYRDSLTGLYNKNKYEVDKAIAQLHHERFGIIMMDVNGLKLYNDTYGHDAGDELLQRAANIIMQTFKTYNCDCYRVGGDEFVILVYSDIDSVCTQCQEIIEEACNLYNKGRENEDTIGITIASGYAIWFKGKSISKVEHEADRWMYNHKKSMQRNGVKGIRIKNEE